MKYLREAEKPISELSDLVSIGDIAMLTTKTIGGHLRGRPMEVCHISDNGDIYFFAQTSDEITAEITDHNHVSLCFRNSADDDYTSVSGMVQLSKNNEDMVAFWDNKYERWIHEGLENPSIVLIKINPMYAEHWNLSGLMQSIIKFIQSGEKAPDLVHEKLYG